MITNERAAIALKRLAFALGPSPKMDNGDSAIAVLHAFIEQRREPAYAPVWRDDTLWFGKLPIGRVRREKPAPADPEGGYWWSWLCGSETGPIVGIEAAKAKTFERAISALPQQDAGQ